MNRVGRARETMTCVESWTATTTTFVMVIVVMAVSSPSAASTSSSPDNVATVLSSLSRLLDYFRANYQQVVNLDTVFGLRVIEGQSKLLVDDFEHGLLEFITAADGGPIKSIRSLGAQAGRLANMAVPHVHESDRQHLILLKNLVQGPFKMFHPHRVINPSLQWIHSNYKETIIRDSVDYEDGIDECLGELMAIKCNPTANCLVMMLSPGYAGHRMQSQIFYTILVQKMGCEIQVNEYLVGRTKYRNVEEVQHEFCTNAYYELEAMTLKGIPPEFRELFLEMEFFCPSLGYFQFMKMEWLENIVSWQSNDGCFPKQTVAINTIIPLQDHQFQVHHLQQRQQMQPQQYYKKFENHGDVAQELRWPINQSLNLRNHIPVPFNRGLKTIDSPSQRSHKERRHLTGDCLSHFTSMASCALSLYLRYLLDPGPPEFLHLRLENYLRMPRISTSTSASKLAPPVMPETDPSNGQLNMGDMLSKAWNFMGTYQRHWGPRFQYVDQPNAGQLLPAIYVNPNPGSDINRAQIDKQLPDWTVSLIDQVITTTTNDDHSVTSKSVIITDHQISVQIDESIQAAPLQGDLKYYLIIVALISSFCLLAFMHYFRCCRASKIGIANAGSKCKTRHF